MARHRLICGDVLEVLPTIGQRFDVAICDPPDNLGLKYDGFDDNQTHYTDWLEVLIYELCIRADIVWVSYNAKHTFDVGGIIQYILRVFPDYEAKPFVQTFTFGQNNNQDCGNGHRPIVRLKHKEARLYPDQIRVPSWRQENGDKRACPDGRVPLDVWEFPRVTGNSRQRRAWHPTQLHEDLVERMILMSTPNRGTSHVLDACSGTGTVLRAAKKLEQRAVTSIEISPAYCEKIAEEHGLSVEYPLSRAA